MFESVSCFLPGRRSLAVAVLCGIFVSCHSSASAQDNDSESKPPMKVTEIEGISEYSLENGTRVLLFPDASKDVVTVNMTVFVGSRHEGYGEAGMAHLLEHMLFKGTPRHPNVPKVLQDRGARFNGTTWMDRTNYYETLQATDDNLEFALALEADRLVNSFIKGEDLESEMTVVRNEFERGENSAFRVLMQRMQSSAYDWHNYGQSTIGNRSDIERVPVVKLRQFYRKYYRPDNVLVIVAGKFDTEHALESIAKNFGALKNPDTPLDPTYTVEPPKDGERTVVLRRVGDVQNVGTAYHIPAGSHPEYAAAKALMYILGDEPSGRLYTEMVETEMATNVYALAYAFNEPGLFMSLLEVPLDVSIEQARVKLIEVMEQSFADHPVTEKEVERAKQNMLKARESQAANTDKLAVSLSDWAAQGDWRLYFLFRDEVESLTAEKVQAFAEKYFVRNNRTVGLYLPSEDSERVSIPESPDLVAKLKGYVGRETVDAGEEFDTDLLAIEPRVERGDLVGGIKYAMLPKKTRGGKVSLMLTLRFGTGETLHGKLAAVEMLGMLMSRGSEKLNYLDLQDELTRLRAELSMSSTQGVLQTSVQTKEEFLPEVLDLLMGLVKSPALEASELEILRRQIVTSLQQSRGEPNSLAPKLVNRRLAPYEAGDLRYQPTIEEEISMYENVSADEIRSLYERFLGNHAGELAVVGNFHPQTVKDLFVAGLEDWTSSEPYVRVGKPAHPEIPGVVETIETPDKSNALLYSGAQVALSDVSKEYASLVMGNFILGGGSLASRLGDRVRQQEGLSYGVRSGVTASSKDERVNFTLYAITNPQNKDRLLEVIREEVVRLKQDGVTEDELTRAKESHLQAAKLRRSDDKSLLSLLVLGLLNDRTLQVAADNEQRIRSTTVQSVNAAVRKYVDMDKLVIAVAGDFANNPPADESESSGDQE